MASHLLWVLKIVLLVTWSRVTNAEDKCASYTGVPVIDINGKEIFCGRGPERQDCPDKTSCSIEAADRWAVCCVTKTVDYPCNANSCSAGQKCVPKQVTCVTTPCPPLAECISAASNSFDKWMGVVIFSVAILVLFNQK